MVEPQSPEHREGWAEAAEGASDGSPAETGPTSGRGREIVRWTVRLVLLAGAGLVLLSDVARDSLSAAIPAGFSPYAAIHGMVAGGTLTAFGLAGLAAAAVSAFRLRWFCRWVCPLGTCNEFSSRLGRRAGLQSHAFPRLGRFLVFLALGGALVGSPILLWLDPLALFSGLGQRSPAVPAQWAVGISGAAVAMAISFFLPGLWCNRVCPLGGLQEILFAGRRGLNDGMARRFAKSVAGDASVAGPARPAASPTEAAIVGRRTALALAGGFVWAWMGPRIGAATQPLRPPGAFSDDRRFLSLCVRCGNCVRVCPTGIVRPQLFSGPPTTWLVPQVTFSDNFCLPTCNRCGDVCPSGALTPFSLEQKQATVIGKAVLESDLCLLSEDRECGVCRSHCPYHAIRLEFNEETYSVLPVVDLERCPGCGACEAICPTTPRKAIRVERF